MKIEVILHSYLREYLPAEAKGKTTLELPDGSTIQDVIIKIGIPGEVVCAVNEQIEPNWNRILENNDHLRFLRPGAGGWL